MPKRKRRRDDTDGSNESVDPQVALFARRHQEDLERQKTEQRAAAERRRREEEHQRLVAEKDDAVARVKALRGRARVPPEAAAEADAAYKAATAALIEFETGARPTWATEPEE
jgi:hypothetical protein